MKGLHFSTAALTEVRVFNGSVPDEKLVKEKETKEEKGKRGQRRKREEGAKGESSAKVPGPGLDFPRRIRTSSKH